MAPEALTSNTYNKKTDVWAFGALLYEIFHGESPYAQARDAEELIRMVYTPLSERQMRKDLSPQMKELILACLEVDLRKRRLFSEILKMACLRKLFEGVGNGKAVNTEVLGWQGLNNTNPSTIPNNQFLAPVKVGGQLRSSSACMEISQRTINVPDEVKFKTNQNSGVGQSTKKQHLIPIKFLVSESKVSGKSIEMQNGRKENVVEMLG
jgi:NIMA (never in mitosis gene a)-related kinase